MTKTPRAVWVFTGLLFLGSVVAGRALWERSLDAMSQPGWLILPLTLALVVAGTLQVEFRYRRDVEAIDLYEAALTPLVLAFAGPVAIAAAMAAKLASQRWLRVAAPKAAFNTAQWGAATAVASWVYLVLAGDAAGTTSALLALLAAMAVAAVVNELATGTVLWLVQGRPFRETLIELLPGMAPGWVVWCGAQAFGLLFALALASSAVAGLLTLVPLVFLHRAHKAYAAVQADKARLEGLHRATAVLAGPVDPVDALPDFVAEIRHAFGAATVELVVFDPPSVVRAGRTANDTAALELAEALACPGVSRIRVGDGSGEVSQLLDVAGHHDALVAPLLRDGRIIGALAAYDRSGFAGFEEGEEAVFALLATDAGSALEKHDLLTAVVGERQKLAEIVDRSSDGIFTVAADGRVASWNPAMEAITGFPAADMVGSVRLAALRARNEHEVDVALESWAGGPPLPPDVRILTRDGVERWLSCSYAVSPDAGTLVVVARDATAAREVERMKDDFVATVSHELRTPLTAITGFTHLLLDPPGELSEDDRHDSLTRISTSAHRLSRMVQNLLELSRIEAQPKLPVAEVDLTRVIRRATEELSASAPGRRLLVHAPAGRVPVLGDELSIERILVNLLSNAVKYASEGAVELRVTSDRAGVSVTVSDEGPGIPDHARETVFERFVRLDTHDQQAGTGLGLYISRQLAHHMGATLTLEPSGTGRGATFDLRLRAAGVPSSADVDLVVLGEGSERGLAAG